MSSDVDDLLERALGYAARGWAVFPLVPGGKEPFKGSHGFREATTKADVIRLWWKITPDANIGVATGRISGIFVIDADLYKGADKTLAQLEEQYGPLPATYTVQTPRGGRHFYFTLPQGRALAGGQNKLGQWIDVKGEGGYVAAPPSRVGGGAYKGVNAMKPSLPPDWVVERASQNRESREIRDTEEIEKQMSSPVLCASLPLCLSVSSISEAVALSLPNGPHDNHRCLFLLARALKSLEATKGQPLNKDEKMEAFGSWFEQAGARDFLRPEQTRDDYLAEFLHAVRKAKLPLGAGPAEQAWARAQCAPLPPEADFFGSESAKRVVALCWQLERMAKGQPWFLSGRTLSNLTGLSHGAVIKLLSALIELRVIEIVEAHTTTKATRYRYKVS